MGFGIEDKRKLSEKRIEELQMTYGTPEQKEGAKKLPEILKRMDKVKIGDIPIVGRIVKTFER